MSEPLQLLLLLGALYLLECAQWTPLEAVGFRAWLPGLWALLHPWHAGPSWRLGALLGLPWPPLSPPLVCQPLPLRLGPRGIALAGDPPGWLRWEEVGAVAIRDRDLLGGDRRLARLATRRLTLELGRLLPEVAALKPARRAARLRRFLEGRWDDRACVARLVAFRRRGLALRLSANLLWLTVFVGAPLLIWTPLTVLWPQVALAALLAWLACAVIFRLTLLRLDLEREAWPDGTHRFMAAASPLSSMRAADLLGRELCGDLEPLAVAAALLPAARLGELARHALLDLDEREAPKGSEAAEDAAWLLAEERACLLRLLERRGLRAEELLAPPAPEDDRVLAFCPRCRGQYLRGERCLTAGCRDRALVPFER